MNCKQKFVRSFMGQPTAADDNTQILAVISQRRLSATSQ